MSLLPIRANAEQTAVHHSATDRTASEPNLTDVQQFALKTAQLQQADNPQSPQATTDTVKVEANVHTSGSAANKQAELMDVFYKQLTDSVLKDIITKCKVEIDQD